MGLFHAARRVVELEVQGRRGRRRLRCISKEVELFSQILLCNKEAKESLLLPCYKVRSERIQLSEALRASWLHELSESST